MINARFDFTPFLRGRLFLLLLPSGQQSRYARKPHFNQRTLTQQSGVTTVTQQVTVTWTKNV